MLLLVARRDKTTIKAVYRLTDEVPYLPVYCALFCPYLHKDKATKRATAFGLIWAAFLRNTAKPLFSLLYFPPLFWQNYKLLLQVNLLTCHAFS